jgi:hypothetical protein
MFDSSHDFIITFASDESPTAFWSGEELLFSYSGNPTPHAGFVTAKPFGFGKHTNDSGR